MRVVMTLMVRDEADIVGAMLEHHRRAGVDHVLVTDNGSQDATLAILEEFVADGWMTLWHDPVHRKQQYQNVTTMARYAATDLGADWVINADADEFLLPTDRSRSIHDVLGGVRTDIPSLTVPVVNLTGSPAPDGSGLDRLVYRDQRTESELHAAGIPFHPTANAVHRAHPEIEISQGNHFVSAPGWSESVLSAELEVLHLPWRSWRQYERKVRNAGAAYLANPELQPSPRHHGMQDYRRLLGGRLEALYVSKHPRTDEVATLVESGSLRRDSALRALGQTFPGARPDTSYGAQALLELNERGRQFAALEAELEDRLQALLGEQAHERELWLVGRQEQRENVERLTQQVELLAQELERARNRRVVRAVDGLARLVPRRHSQSSPPRT